MKLAEFLNSEMQVRGAKAYFQEVDKTATAFYFAKTLLDLASCVFYFEIQHQTILQNCRHRVL